MNKLFFFTLILAITLSSYLLIPLSPGAHAQEEQIAENVKIQAFIESNASKIDSHVEADKTEVLADKSNVVIITVTVRDNQRNPLENKTVTLISNRGEIDTIEPVANGITAWLPVVYAASANGSASARTDKEGKARFKVSSNVAGKAIFRVIVDGYIELDPIEITFNGLPFPSSLTITASTPTLGGLIPAKLITLFKPTQESSEVVNTGVNVNIPASLFLIILIFFGGAIYFAIYDYFSSRRIKQLEQTQIKILIQAIKLLKENKLDGQLEIDEKLRRELDGKLKTTN